MNAVEEGILKFREGTLSKEEKVKLLETISDEQLTETVPFLIEMLSDDRNNPTIRNVIALTLSELSADVAVPYIMAQIKYPLDMDNTATLIYSLQSLDC